MDGSDDTKERQVLYDEEDWMVVLGPCLSNDPATAEGLARMFFELRRAINRGPDGVSLASNTLLAGLRQIYLYTDAHQAAFDLFETYLQGNLKPADEPLVLLRSAIKRGQAAEVANAKERTADSRSLEMPDKDRTPSDEQSGDYAEHRGGRHGRDKKEE